ncbi:MAG: glutamate synthase [bacterium]|nr:glutamate synthase [bacterium]
MAHLSPIPLPDLVRRMRREAEVNRSIFDLPVRKWFIAERDLAGDELDLSARHFARRASTPVGPAAGPHTQLAQNIVLAWLAGSRIIELKTVQVQDRLEIPRPCIHVPNVGFNVEWSQELRVGESLLEYAKAIYLIEILKATRGFGLFPSNRGFDTIFDISVGYDLEGIRSEKVTGFLRSMRKPAPIFEQLRRQLHGELAELRDLELPGSISECVTLSTFHGCPADQIEAIARYLIGKLGLHTIIKLNPTLLGFEAVRELLIERLGYQHVELCREAFEQDLRYDDALEILRRLRTFAGERGSSIGAKFTNTLVVANRSEIFPTHGEPYMYLSGPPLHVISMNLMQRCREQLGFEMPVSFSAGIDAKNFASAVACGMVPVTTCTDLLRQGGYARLPAYLRSLAKEMRRLGVTSRDAYVLALRGHGAEAAVAALRSTVAGAEVWERRGRRLTALAGEAPDTLPRALREAAATVGLDAEKLVERATRVAGRLNGRDLIAQLADDPRYHARSNAKAPRRVDSTLGLYDCINCDLCISACPNDAIFAYEVEPTTTATEHLRLTAAAGLVRTPGQGFAIRDPHQLAVVEGACNECSNCEVYCPEHGAPFVVKERIFLSREAFAASELDGFCRQGLTLHARLGGLEMRLEPEPEHNRATLAGEDFRLELSWNPLAVKRGHLTGREIDLDSALSWRMKTVWESIFQSPRPNMVNVQPSGESPCAGVS